MEKALIGKEEQQPFETYTIDCVSQGEEGLKMVEESIKKKKPYSVAFIDVRMPPGIDGIETISKIWEIYPDLQIVICTAYSDYSWEELFNKFGHTDKLLILKKPFDNIEVRQLTHNLCKKWELNKIANLKMNELEEKVDKRTKELNETKMKYKNLYDYAPDMYFSVNPKGIVLSVNNCGAEHLGYKPDELAGNSIWIVVYKEDLKEIQKRVSEIFKKKLIKSELEFRKIKKDGSILWVHERTYLFLDDNGNPKELLIMCRDITDKKQAEEELQQSEEKYRTMIEHSNDMIWTLDTNGNFLYFNERSEELTGYKIKDGVGKTFVPIILEEDLEMVGKVFKDTLAGNSNHYEVRIHDSIRKNILTLSVNTAPIYKDGKVTGTVSFGRDITKRKKTEEALHESEERYRNIFEHSPFGIITFDVKGNPINANKEVLNILGSPSIKETRKINVLKYPPLQKNGFSSNFLKCLKSGKVISTETKYVSKWGRESFIHYTMTPIHIKENRIGAILSIFEDISERFLAEKALQESEKRFRQFFANSPEYCFIISLEGTILDINKSALKALGYLKKELIGKPLLTKIYTSSSQAKAQKLFKKWSTSGELRNEELNVITKDGKERTVLLSVDAIRGTKGEIIHSILMQRDITDREQAEKKLKKSEEKLRNFVDFTPLGIWCFQPEKPVKINIPEDQIIAEFFKSICVECNDTYANMMGVSKEEILRLKLSDAMPDTDENRNYLRTFIKKGFKLSGGISRELTKDGKEKYFSNSMIGVIKQGELINAWGTQSDITEHKQAEKALKESEQLSRAVVESSPIGISIRDCNGTLLLANETWKKIWELTRKQVTEYSKPREKLIMDKRDDYLGKHIKKVTKVYENGGEYFIPEIELLGAKNKKTKWISQHFYAIKNEKGSIERVVILTEDITERKQAEKIQSVLYNIANVVNTTKDIQELFKAIRDHLSAIVNTDNFYIALYDKEKDSFSLPYHTDEKDKFDSFPAGRTLTAYVVRTGKPLFGTEEKREKLIQAGKVKKGKIGAHAKIWVGVPLRLGKEILGVIAVQSYTNVSLYSERDLEILEFVSDEIALAIAHKQAEESLKNKNKELIAFNKIAVGREMRMIDLKKEINVLLKSLAKEPKYKIAE
jgi:PAS domain S-box-containing protein